MADNRDPLWMTYDPYWMNDYQRKILRRMKKRGYHYNEIESYRGRILFDYEGATLPLEFASFKDVQEWIQEVESY